MASTPPKAPGRCWLCCGSYADSEAKRKRIKQGVVLLLALVTLVLSTWSLAEDADQFDAFTTLKVHGVQKPDGTYTNGVTSKTDKKYFIRNCYIAPNSVVNVTTSGIIVWNTSNCEVVSRPDAESDLLTLIIMSALSACLALLTVEFQAPHKWSLNPENNRLHRFVFVYLKFVCSGFSIFPEFSFTGVCGCDGILEGTYVLTYILLFWLCIWGNRYILRPWCEQQNCTSCVSLCPLPPPTPSARVMPESQVVELGHAHKEVQETETEQQTTETDDDCECCDCGETDAEAFWCIYRGLLYLAVVAISLWIGFVKVWGYIHLDVASAANKVAFSLSSIATGMYLLTSWLFRM